MPQLVRVFGVETVNTLRRAGREVFDCNGDTLGAHVGAQEYCDRTPWFIIEGEPIVLSADEKVALSLKPLNPHADILQELIFRLHPELKPKKKTWIDCTLGEAVDANRRGERVKSPEGLVLTIPSTFTPDTKVCGWQREVDAE